MCPHGTIGCAPAGHDVVSIGKLHFRSAEDDNGFSAVHHPIYVMDGIGDTHGLLRTKRQVRAVARELATEAGRGPSPYTRYDATVADATARWIRERASRSKSTPWVLFSSMVSPHYPLIAPDAFYDLYDGVALPRPRHYDAADRPDHPVIAHYRDTWNYDDFFDADRLAAGLRAYYGLCSFLDHQIGKILRALDECGFADDTLVIYTSDHGESLGNRGLWGKSVMYEEASAVPLVAAGPGMPVGQRCSTAVSLVDIYPTVVEAHCGALDERERALPGESLVALARAAPRDRVVFGELHDDGALTGHLHGAQGRLEAGPLRRLSAATVRSLGRTRTRSATSPGTPRLPRFRDSSTTHCTGSSIRKPSTSVSSPTSGTGSSSLAVSREFSRAPTSISRRCPTERAEPPQARPTLTVAGHDPNVPAAARGRRCNGTSREASSHGGGA